MDRENWQDMAKNLVVVESPAKARTLARYLGRNFTVKASVGHVADLPKSRLGVDLEHDFRPEYQLIHGKKKVVEEIKKAAKGKEYIYLAPDPDREGEAIAWHIAEELGRPKNLRRVLFNEITKRAVEEAIKHPQQLDRNKFEAQQARRILDRLVGYKLSPLLWEKVKRGLSAGRVQSVAVRLIVEREQQIRAFQSEEFWTVEAELAGEKDVAFRASLFKVGSKRLDHKNFRLADEAAAKAVTDRLERESWRVVTVETKERRRSPTPPFITSKLQQEAARKLRLQPQSTMRIAQRLYEGVELGEEGAVGLITYMRTDSTRVSAEAVRAAREYISGEFGAEYLPEKPPVYRSKKSAQDAHEAIRPTSMEYRPERVAKFLSREELAVYTLIWNRFVASQMAPARFEQTAVDVAAGDCIFRATGQVVLFDGFMGVYSEGRDDNGEGKEEATLPPLREGERLRLLELVREQHFTQPPPRFSQASLIKELEEKGIGRPSTYASIIGTILNKEYVREDRDRRLFPTELGILVTELLVEAFPDVLNVEFTADMEETLDRIEEGKQTWTEALRRFYEPFSRDLERAQVQMRNVKTEGRKTEIRCDSCGEPMVIRWGRRGEFLACSGYPSCKNTSDFTLDDHGRVQVVREELSEEVCEKCGKPMQVRFGRYGKFLGCSGYPECRNVKPVHKPIKLGFACPRCSEGELLEKRSRRGKVFFSCSRYPKCDFVTWDRPVAEECPSCHASFTVEKTTRRNGTVRRCVGEGCAYEEKLEDTGT